MLGKPVLIVLSLVCLMCVVAVGMLAGDIAFGLTGSTETRAMVRYSVIGAIAATAVLLGLKAWRRRSS